MSWLGPQDVLVRRALAEYEGARIRLEVPPNAPLRLLDDAMPNWLASATFIVEAGWFLVFSVMAFHVSGLSWMSFLDILVMIVAFVVASRLYQSTGLALAIVAGLILSRPHLVVTGTFGFYPLVVFTKSVCQWYARDRIKRLALGCDDNLVRMLRSGLASVLPTAGATKETELFLQDLQAAVDGCRTGRLPS